MRRFTEILSGSAAMLFQVALTGWMFALSEINFDFVTMELNYILLSAVLLLGYYINMAVMRRGIPVPLFAIIEIALVAAGAYAFIKSVYIEPFELRTVIINCIIYCLGFAVSAFIAWTPTNQNGILMRFDALFIMTAIMLVLDHILVMPAADGAVTMCVVSLVLTLLASVSLKSGALIGRGSAVEGNAALGRILLIVIAGILGLIAVLVIIYAASGVKSFSEFLLAIITTLAGWGKAALLFLYGLLEKFAQWLAQFADDTPMESMGMEAGPALNIPPGEETVGSVPVWLYYALGAAAAAALVYIIYRLRKYRTVSVRRSTNVVVRVRRESGLWKALRELWEKLCTEMRFRFNCTRYRRSAPGLLAWCEKHADESLTRHTDESGERYLLRIGSVLGGDAGEALCELAGLVERSFYAPVPVTVSPELYRAVRKIKLKTEEKK